MFTDTGNKTDVESTTTEILENGLPLPQAVSTQVYNVSLPPSYIDNERCVVTDSLAFTAIKPSLLESQRGNKAVVIRGNDQRIYIPKPDTEGMTKEEIDALWAYEKVDGVRRPKMYKDSNGKEIIDRDTGKPIPIPKKFNIDFSYTINNKERDFEAMKSIIQRYLSNPEMLSSYDGHAGIKHDYDSILALRLLTAKSVFGESFCKAEVTPRRDSSGKQMPHIYNYIVTTDGVVTMPGDILPQRPVHTQVSKETAEAVRERLNNSRTDKERKTIADNFKRWVKDFSDGDTLLGMMMYCEVMYMLKFDYYKSYEQERRFTTEDIGNVFTKEELLDITGGRAEYVALGNSIYDIFSKERVDRDRSYTEQFLSLESKVDDSIKLIENTLPDENLDSLRVIGGFNRRVKPMVVFGGVATRNRVYPTNSLTTSYLKEFDNTSVANDISRVLVGKNKEDDILENAIYAREKFNSLLDLRDREGEKDRDVHVREVKTLSKDRTLVREISERLEDTLGMNSEQIEKFHELVMKNR